MGTESIVQLPQKVVSATQVSCCCFAAYVGCDRIVLGGHQYYLKTKGQIKEKECQNIAKLLNKVGKTCDDYGIKATYHPNKSDMAKRGDFVEKICDLTDPDLVDL